MEAIAAQLLIVYSVNVSLVVSYFSYLAQFFQYFCRRLWLSPWMTFNWKLDIFIFNSNVAASQLFMWLVKVLEVIRLNIFYVKNHESFILYSFRFLMLKWSNQSVTVGVHNIAHFNPLNANFIKWSNTLKQFVGNLPTNCLSMFDHFVGLVLKGLRNCRACKKSYVSLQKNIKNIAHGCNSKVRQQFSHCILNYRGASSGV